MSGRYTVKLLPEANGYSYVIRSGGEEVATGWSCGTRKEATAEAREHANELGFDDEVNP